MQLKLLSILLLWRPEGSRRDKTFRLDGCLRLGPNQRQGPRCEAFIPLGQREITVKAKVSARTVEPVFDTPVDPAPAEGGETPQLTWRLDGKSPADVDGLAGRVFGHYRVVPGRLRYGAIPFSKAGGEYFRRPGFDGFVSSDHRILNLARDQQMAISYPISLLECHGMWNPLVRYVSSRTS